MPTLTPHRQKILQFVAGGMTYKEIADKLEIHHQTVKNTVHEIYRIYGVSNKTQAVIEGLKRGHVNLEIAYQHIMERRRQEDIC